MSSLAEHTGHIELELAQMTRDGHHANYATDRAMRMIDDALREMHNVVHGRTAGPPPPHNDGPNEIGTT